MSFTALILASQIATASPAPPAPLFPANEALHYTLKFIDTTAGECDIETLAETTWETHAVHHFRATVRTVGLIGVIYPYTETVDVYYDRAENRPLFVDINIHDRKKTQHTQIRLDATALHGKEIEDSTEPGEPPHHREKNWALASPSQSLFTILHFMRTQQLNTGSEVQFPIAHDEKNVTFVGEVLRVEPVPTAKGERDGVLVRVGQKFANVFYPNVKETPLLWFSNDDRKLPLRFELKHKLGRVFAVLKNPPPPEQHAQR